MRGSVESTTRSSVQVPLPRVNGQSRTPSSALLSNSPITVEEPFPPAPQYLWVTPEMAEQWLEQQVELYLLNPDIEQRSLSQVRVTQYARMMADGHWAVNGETISVTDDGLLLNGQHRLHAIVMAGVPVVLCIARGIKKEAFATMDQGKVRSLNDLLTIKNVSYRVEVSGGCRVAMVYQETGCLMPGGSFRPTTGELLDYVMKHVAEFLEAATMASGAKIGHKAALTGLAFMVRGKPQERRLFFEKLQTGADLGINDPVRVLRERLLSENGRRAKNEQEFLFALIIKGWNAFVQDRSISVLRFAQNEEYPSLIV